jgi:hypothetical protein
MIMVFYLGDKKYLKKLTYITKIPEISLWRSKIVSFSSVFLRDKKLNDLFKND